MNSEFPPTIAANSTEIFKQIDIVVRGWEQGKIYVARMNV